MQERSEIFFYKDLQGPYLIKSNLVNLCGDSAYLFSVFPSVRTFSDVFPMELKRAFLLGVVTMLELERPTSDLIPGTGATRNINNAGFSLRSEF